jgi:hypothetical protein
VDQEEVDLVETQPVEGLPEGAPRIVGTVEAVVELGGDPELLARDPGGLDRRADTFLVAVHLRRVDVPVARLEGLLDGLLRLLGWDLEDPEAELGDLPVVVEGHGRDVGIGHARADNTIAQLIPSGPASGVDVLSGPC